MPVSFVYEELNYFILKAFVTVVILLSPPIFVMLNTGKYEACIIRQNKHVNILPLAGIIWPLCWFACFFSFLFFLLLTSEEPRHHQLYSLWFQCWQSCERQRKKRGFVICKFSHFFFHIYTNSGLFVYLVLLSYESLEWNSTHSKSTKSSGILMLISVGCVNKSSLN